jgi:hypothetical protein
VDWKHLICLWLEDQGYSYSFTTLFHEPIHVRRRYYRLDQLFDVYIVNLQEQRWGPVFSGLDPKFEGEINVCVQDAKSEGRVHQFRKRAGYERGRPGEHPDSWRYHVGDIGDPKFFTRLTLGMNKMRVKDDGAGRRVK